MGLFICITGVSGSGKSTLINETLYRAMAHYLYGSATEPAPHKSIDGMAFFDKVINMDQSPIGRTPVRTPPLIPVCSHPSGSYLQACLRHASGAMTRAIFL